MPTAPIQYPLDLTGGAASNLIVGEPHDLSGLTSKAFVLNEGPFYTHGLVVTNAATGTVLNPNTQYVAAQLFVDLTLRTGMEVCSVIVITDPTLPANLVVNVTAQIVGGEYSSSVNAIQQLIDALNLGNQPITWGAIIGKPVAWTPAPHLHDMGDLYGFEYIVAALNRVTQAVYTGDTAQFQAVYQYIDHVSGGLTDNINAFGAQLTNHLVDYTNPHRVTKAQVGLGNVDNFVTATNASATNGSATTQFMTPGTTVYAINALAVTPLNAHIARSDNPHSVTKAQVGLGLVPNSGWAATADAQAGTATTGFMNPQLTAAAVTAQVGNAFQAHIRDTGNPHSVTKAQVGLGNVDNFATASSTDAQNGTATNLFMTPATTAAAIRTNALSPLNAHIARTDNPHSVTKAQVGLGLVNNYDFASQAQAQQGQISTAYMTPWLTAQAIAYQALNPLNAHIARTDNPHSVTQGQVGLGNVQNVPQVQRGGGVGMLSNVIMLGWNGSSILAQVDSTPMGTVFTTSQPDPNLTSHIANRGNPHGVNAGQIGLGNVNNTADANKPVSGPQQSALDQKATLGSSPYFNTVAIGGDQILIYESAQGALSIRSGSSGQGYNYSTFAANGDLSIPGTFYGGRGFQPSDERFKDNIDSVEPRPLWRDVDYKRWTWNETTNQAGDAGRGVVAQALEKAAPEHVRHHAMYSVKDAALVDYAGLAFETAMAAGREVDRLRAEVASLKAIVISLTQTRRS